MKLLKFYCVTILAFLLISSCKHEDGPEPDNSFKRTLIVYMPWATNLYSSFRQNIDDLEEAIETNGLKDQRILVYIADSHASADLFEIKLNKGVCQKDTLKRYTFDDQLYNMDYTTDTGLTSIFTDIILQAPANEYSMIVGCHGSGWTPVTRSTNTRAFGGTTGKYQTDISTLRKALENVRIKLQFLLFDDCYMANAEVAYELRNVTNYIIASTSEIMGYGMPYHTMGKYLLGTPNYQSVCNEFLAFYNNYSSPYGTISVTNTSVMDNLATEMKKLNEQYTIDNSTLNTVQKLDGYNPSIFFDCGDYISKLSNGAGIQALQQLERAVPYQAHTEDYCTAMGSYFSLRTFPIYTFSGLTISDPSSNSLANQKKETSWWKATH